MAVNTAIFFFQYMKITRLILSENDTELAQREAVMDSPLYRGVRKELPADEIIRLPIRQDRRPRDSTMYETVMYNAAFEAAHGIKDVRSSVLFCSVDPTKTIQYANSDNIKDESNNMGSVVRVYPLKSAKIAFKKGIHDSWRAIEQIRGMFDKALVPYERLFSHDGTPISNTTNCLAVVKFLIDEMEGEFESKRAGQAFKNAVEYMKSYEIHPATALPSLNLTNEEVMVFDSQYYYASALSTDEVLDLHD